jgi:hypothetical protein
MMNKVHKPNCNLPLSEPFRIASMEVDIEVNTGKTKCVFMSGHQNAEQNCNFAVINKSFENVTMFKYLE